VPFRLPGGEELLLDMTVMPLTDAQRTEVGAVVSFKDNTELAKLKRRVRHFETCGSLIGRDPKTLGLFEQIREVGPVNVPVLIEGDSGTGKELVARAIHEMSPRANKPLIVINCGALPEGLLESELFGHVRGAFTGAMREKRGRFELADGGTIFLDEVAELSPGLQVKLLRVLQERKFERIGDEKLISSMSGSSAPPTAACGE
jgi:transcriptional regulator with GAF, ATPase, and Fis domain